MDPHTRLSDADWEDISESIEISLNGILDDDAQTALAWARTPEFYARPGEAPPQIDDFGALHADGVLRDAFSKHGFYRFFHGADDDLFVADARPSWVAGNTGDDTLIGGLDDDYLLGFAGDDILGGSLGDDTLFGGPGDDIYVVVDAGDRVRELDDEGFDTARVLFDGFKAPRNLERIEIWNDDGIEVTGSGAKQWFEGGDGGDVIRGGGRSDKIYGEGGDDVLIGQSGGDRLVGGDGDDALKGGNGKNHLYGGDGADRFVLREGDGLQRVYDFTPGEDVLDLRAFDLPDFAAFEALAETNNRGHTKIAPDLPARFLLVGVEAEEIGAGDVML